MGINNTLLNKFTKNQPEHNKLDFDWSNPDRDGGVEEAQAGRLYTLLLDK